MKKRILSGILLAVLLLCTGCARQERAVRITIPAGSRGDMVWSDQEISPRGRSVTFSCGEGLGDCAVNLLPTEVQEETAYDEPQYLTPGLSVKMDAEQGGWFRVGVSVYNESGTAKHVYVQVDNVDVRMR